MEENNNHKEETSLNFLTNCIEFEVNSDVENESKPGHISPFKITPLKDVKKNENKELSSDVPRIAYSDHSKNSENETSEETKANDHIKIFSHPKSPKGELNGETQGKQNLTIKKLNFISKRSNSQSNNEYNSCYKAFTQRFFKNFGKAENDINKISQQTEDSLLKYNNSMKLNQNLFQNTFEERTIKKGIHSHKKISKYDEKIKDDLDHIPEMQAIPVINPKSKKIIQRAQKIQENNKIENIFEKLSKAKHKESTQLEKFPFKPKINQIIKTKADQKPKDDSKKILEKVIKDHDKIYKDLKEKKERKEHIKEKKTEMSINMQIRNLNNEIDLELKKINLSNDFICQDNLRILMESLSYLHGTNYKGENELFKEFWDICSNNQNEAKIENVKILLIVISKILQPEMIEKKLNSNVEARFKLNLNLNLNESKFDLFSFNVSKENDFCDSEDLSHSNKMLFDNDQIIILSMKTINELTKKFIPLYCNRLSRKIKNESKGFLNRKALKNENSDKCVNGYLENHYKVKKNSVISDLIQRLFSFSSRPRTPIKESNLPQLKISKNELISRIATSTPTKTFKNQDTSNDQKQTFGKEKLEKLYFCKKKRLNKSQDRFDFEKSKDFLTFSPKIIAFKIGKKSCTKLSISQESEIQRMRRGHSERRSSLNFLDLFSKQGQTSIKNDICRQKFKNDIKSLNVSDIALNQIVCKYIKNYEYDSKNREKKQIIDKLFNKYDILKQKNSSPERITLNLNTNNLKKQSTSQSRLRKESSTIPTSIPLKSFKDQLEIALIKINNNEGVKTIKVTNQGNLPEITAKIAKENSSLNRFK